MIDIILGLHLLSYHVPNEPWYNNHNVGVYARAETIELGVYQNTDRRVSVYVAKEFALSDNWSFTAGGVTGYSKRRVFNDDLVCQTGNPSTIIDRCYEDQGFWRHGPIAPFVSIGYKLPKFGGVQPRVDFVPGKSSVFHLRLEY